MTKIEGPCHKWNPDFQEGIVVGRLRTAHNIVAFLDERFEEFSNGENDPIKILGQLDDYLYGLLNQ